MSIHLQTIIILMSLIAGVVSVFLSNRLMRKFPSDYLSSYFYFLIFINIFGVYSIIGSSVIETLLNNHGTPEETVRSARMFLISLGIPFLILAWYMFIRLTREFFSRGVSSFFSLVYFIVFLLIFSAFILMHIQIRGLEKLWFQFDRISMILLFTVLNSLIFLGSIITALWQTKKLNDINQRRAYRWFLSSYLLIMTLGVVTLNLSSVLPLFGLIFIAVLMGFHLLPLLFLAIYVQKFYVRSMETDSFRDQMELVVEKFGISKREAEVMRLICKGMSNQEISDSLFISLQTVKDHVHRIFIKTGVKNRVQLTNLIGNS